MKAALLTVALLQALAWNAVSADVVLCYYGSWNNIIPSLDPTLCTHGAYAFTGIQENGALLQLNGNDDQEMRKFNDLKKKSSSFKTLLSVGGDREGSIKYSIVANNPVARRRFIDEVLAILIKYKFNGLDLDWEYPCLGDSGNAYDYDNYITWLREIKQELAKHKMILTGAVGAPRATASRAYNIKEMSKYMDYINLMTYDFHGVWDQHTAHNSPLYEAGDNNVDASVNYWLSQGAPANKLLVGLPFYGRSFTLQNAANNGFGAPIFGAGSDGGYVGFNAICANKAWNVRWNDEQQAAYAVNGNQWVGYDNERSMKAKAAYIKKRGLGGAMIWSIDTDDVQGVCGNGKFPLLHALNSVLDTHATGAVVPDPEETNDAPEAAPAPVPAPAPASVNSAKTPCTRDGIFRDPTDCTKFFSCVGGVRYPSIQCQAPLRFDDNVKACNFPQLVKC